MPKVSVIISAYNVEKYIEKSLKSVCSQTLRDIEILAVDDGSTDKTKEIISEIARTDTRIRLLSHEENKGLMLARKTGYDNASGDYIMFLDGDDYYNENACEVAYNAISDENTDILQFGVDTFTEGENFSENSIFAEEIKNLLNNFVSPYSSEKAGGLYNSDDVLKINHCIFNKIYKKELVQKVSAEIPNTHIYLAEDMLFSYIAFFYAKSFGTTSELLCNYRVGTGVSTTTSVTERRRNAVAKCYYIYSFLREWTDKRQAPPACQKRLLKIQDEMFTHINHFFFGDLSKDEREMFCKEVLFYCPADLFICRLIYATFTKNFSEAETLSELCAPLSIFKTNVHKIKTVGILGSAKQELINYLEKKGCKTVQMTSADIPNSTPLSFSETKARVLSVQDMIQTQQIDMVLYCNKSTPLLVADALAVKGTGALFSVLTDGDFLSGWNTLEIYTARTQAVMYKCYAIADFVLTASAQDYSYFKAMGLKCYMQDSFDPANLSELPEIPKPSVAEQTIKALSENVENGIIRHIAKNKTAEELEASVMYAKTLEKQLEEAVGYAHQLEAVIAEKDGYQTCLENAIQDKDACIEALQEKIIALKNPPSLLNKIKNRIKNKEKL
ncbi:MAG: glycosyltransferase family 2 protein [Clostridia bacterium]|nr:glycosyltransferase family 2 protein [Clostridia bacterium]